MTFNEAVTGFALTDLTVTNGTASNLTGSGTTYTADITPNGQGDLVIGVAAGVAQDAATNNNSAATNVTVDWTLPTLQSFTKSGSEDTEIRFAATDFVFSDDDGDPLQSLRVTVIPTLGVLSLSGAAVSAGQILLASQLNNLSYTPNANANGTDRFQVTATDGTQTSLAAEVTLTILPVNDAPSFTLGSTDLTATPGESVTLSAFATGISAGPSNESSQTTTFTVTTNNNSLFATLPSLTEDGTLTYALAPDAAGSATVTLLLQDNGGTANGGVASTSKSFTITASSETETPRLELRDGNSPGQEIRAGLVVDSGTNGFSAQLPSNLFERVEATYDNLIGFYRVTGIDGGIDINGDGVADLLPGQPGYARAALENRLPNASIRAGAINSNGIDNVIFAGNQFYAPFVIANGGALGFDGFLAAEIQQGGTFNNAATKADDQVMYFSYAAANPDGVAHLKNLGNGLFGFEDLPSNLGVSDQDFNDAIFGFANVA